MSCSISMRSLRTVYRICSSRARSSFSGGIDGRPVVEYSMLNMSDNSVRTRSLSVRTARSG